MSRRKGSVSVQVLETLVGKDQHVKNFSETTEEFLKHCTIKGLSPDSVKFYQKELKGLSRAFVDMEVSLSDVRTITIRDIENWVEYMLELNRAFLQ